MTMWLLELLAEHGVDLLMGSTALLGLGAFAMWMHSRPIHVQRMGELTLLAVLGWLVLAVVPMPRFEWEQAVRSNGTPISAELESHLVSRDADRGPAAEPALGDERVLPGGALSTPANAERSAEPSSERDSERPGAAPTAGA